MSLEPTVRAAGVLFVAKDRRALFLKRAPVGDFAGYWCLPGGGIEDGETAEAAARREVSEEVGKGPGKYALEPIARSIRAYETPGAPLPAVPGAGASVSALSVAPAPGAPPAPTTKVVDYATFVARVDEPFEVVLDAESSGFAWAPIDDPPMPLHPGVEIVIRRLAADELGVARMMAAGELTSPQRYRNVTLWAMRITGTGVSYRREVLKTDGKDKVVRDEKTGLPVVLREEEFPWRDPSIYLNDEFLARCNGLPVVAGHPKKSTLDSKEFARRIVGTIFLPYVKGPEVWGIAKVWDDDANEDLANGTEDGGDWSTSPAVVLSDPNNPSYKFRLEDGSLLLVEGKPSLLDHLALCERGVWDKGGEAAGVLNETERTDSMPDKQGNEPTLADVIAAIGGIASRVDDIGARVDSMEKERKDAMVHDVHSSGRADGEDLPAASREDRARKDGESEEDFKARKDAWEKEEKEKADAEKMRKDAEEKERKDAEEKARKDGEGCAERVAADAKKDAEEARKDAASARADSAALRERLSAVEKRLPTDRSDDDHRTMSASQARADSVYEAFGQHAPRFLSGETNREYRNRLVRGLQEHSTPWKAVDVGALADSAFAVAEEQVYADASSAAKNAVGVVDGGLRMVPGRTQAGHQTIEYYGRPSAWLGRFGGARRFATRIRPIRSNNGEAA